jgi:hypothetical protein
LNLVLYMTLSIFVFSSCIGVMKDEARKALKSVHQGYIISLVRLNRFIIVVYYESMKRKLIYCSSYSCFKYFQVEGHRDKEIMLVLNQISNSDLKPNFGYKSRFRTSAS